MFDTSPACSCLSVLQCARLLPRGGACPGLCGCQWPSRHCCRSTARPPPSIPSARPATASGLCIQHSFGRKRQYEMTPTRGNQIFNFHGKEKSTVAQRLAGPALPSSLRTVGVSSPLPFYDRWTSLFHPLQIRWLHNSSLTISCLTGRGSIIFAFIGHVVRVRFGGSHTSSSHRGSNGLLCHASRRRRFRFSCAAPAADCPPLTPASFSWWSTTFFLRGLCDSTCSFPLLPSLMVPQFKP